MMKIDPAVSADGLRNGYWISTSIGQVGKIQRFRMTTMATTLACSNCRAPMDRFACQSKAAGELQIDVCFPCQSVWFDKFESQQMAPSAVLELFRQIQERSAMEHQPWGTKLSCPRCTTDLEKTFDLCRNGKFSYFHCHEKHGRFTSFSALMIEKGFVRQLTGVETSELAKQVRTVRCSGCGTAVDIQRDSVCGYCHAPIVVLDAHAVESALRKHEQAALQERQINPDGMVDALLLTERQKWLDELGQAKARSKSWFSQDNTTLSNGIDLLWTLLHK